jgi:hydroxypyruvate isomerase
VPRFAAHLGWQFTEVPFLERFEAAAATITRVMPLIAHVQIANPPGRNEPGVGEVHFPFLFDLIDRLGYAGWIGLEYQPSRDTRASLIWARPYGIRA